MAHPHLLAPGRIGSLDLRNRILMCPMGDNQATDGGYVTDQQIDYFEARARGGAALLLVGSVGVTAPDGLSTPRQSAIGALLFARCTASVRRFAASGSMGSQRGAACAGASLLAAPPPWVSAPGATSSFPSDAAPRRSKRVMSVSKLIVTRKNSD